MESVQNAAYTQRVGEAVGGKWKYERDWNWSDCCGIGKSDGESR